MCVSYKLLNVLLFHYYGFQSPLNFLFSHKVIGKAPLPTLKYVVRLNVWRCAFRLKKKIELSYLTARIIEWRMICLVDV